MCKFTLIDMDDILWSDLKLLRDILVLLQNYLTITIYICFIQRSKWSKKFAYSKLYENVSETGHKDWTKKKWNKPGGAWLQSIGSIISWDRAKDVMNMITLINFSNKIIK